MTKFFQDCFEHYLSEDELIEIDDLWECVCDGDYPDDMLDTYIPFDMYIWADKIKFKLRKTLTIEVAKLMKSIAYNRHHNEENPNYHITRDEMITINNTANFMKSEGELFKVGSDKFNNDIDKYDISLGKKKIAKKIVEDICPILDDEPDYEEH